MTAMRCPAGLMRGIPSTEGYARITPCAAASPRIGGGEEPANPRVVGDAHPASPVHQRPRVMHVLHHLEQPLGRLMNALHGAHRPGFTKGRAPSEPPTSTRHEGRGRELH